MTAYLRKEFLAKGLKVTPFSLVLRVFLIFIFSIPGNAVESSASGSAFQVATMDKRTDFPVQWVAAGGGVVAYGAGRHVDFTLEGDPFTTVSHLTFDGVISEALILGKYALLSQEGLGLRMIDLSVPSYPQDLGFYPLSGTVFHFASWDNLLFVAGVDPGIQIFELSFSNDQSPPLNLIAREVIPVEGSIMALAASEWKIYAATGKVIKVYDVSDASLTSEIGSLPIALPAQSMAINGDSLYIAAGAGGLHVIDLSIPGNAGSLATYPVQSESLHLAGRLVYLAAGRDGLHLLNAGPIGTTTFTVQVAPGGFSPSTVNINTGDTVQWVWMGSGHTTTSGTSCAFNGPGPNTWDSGILNAGATFQFTFNTPGSFPYFCNAFIQDEPHCAFFGEVGTVNVSGVAPVINISIAPASVNSGSVNVGQFSDQTFTITNQPTSNATLTGNVGTPAAPFSVQTGGGAFSLPPGQSTIVTIRFSPTAAGAASDNLSITHNATNQTSPTNIPLNGTGVTPGAGVVVSFISGPTKGKPGGRIAIQNTVTNQGDQKASVVTVNFYLSTDTQIDTGDTFIGKRTFRNLAPGASSGPASTMVTIPRMVAQGSYFIGAIAGTNTNFDPNGIAICPSLSKPRLLSPKNRGTNISTTPSLTWSNVTGASTYEVQVATDSGFTNIVASMTGLTTPQWAVSPALSSGTTYFWHVMPVNACGSGPVSATWSFKTAP